MYAAPPIEPKANRILRIVYRTACPVRFWATVRLHNLERFSPCLELGPSNETVNGSLLSFLRFPSHHDMVESSQQQLSKDAAKSWI
jgi:hypothetical protein